MGGYLRQSTASVIPFGPFVDKTDGVTLEVGAGIITSIDHATTGIFLSKNGGAGAIRHQNVTASTLDAYGMFLVTLDTTDTNTIGRIRVMMAEAATFLPVYDDFVVLDEAVYDVLFGTTAPSTLTGVAQTGDSYAIVNGDHGLVSIQDDVDAILLDTGTDGVIIPQAQADKIWGTTARVLTAGTNIALAKGTGVTGFNDVSAADVNAQCDTAISDAALATATNLALVKADTAAILLDTGTDGVLLSATAVDAIHDEVVEGTTTLRQAIRLLMSALIGKVSGAPTGPIVYRDLADTKARITATVDENGNRTAVTRDAT
jgi:hypothetical protein